MTTLAQLFPQGPRSEAASATYDDHHTVRRLTEMIGDPRDEFDMTRPRASTERLSRVVEEALADAAPTVIPVPPTAAKKRRRRRFDPLNAIAASLAVVALATAGTVIGVQTANASPADGAMQSLRADEANIQNAEQSFTASHDRIATTITQGGADADALRAAVDGARATADPRANEEDEETVPVLDAGLADQIVAEIDRHKTALQGVVLPEALTPYERTDIDEDSLSEVGVAIQAAQKQLALLDEATGKLRDQRAAVDALSTQHQTTLEGLAASFTKASEQVVEDNPDVEPEFADAVTAAAAGVVSSRLSGAEGIAALTVYRDAVVALITEQARVEQARAEEEERRRREEYRPPVEPEPTPDPTDPSPPPEDPTDPVVEIPGNGGGNSP